MKIRIFRGQFLGATLRHRAFIFRRILRVGACEFRTLQFQLPNFLSNVTLPAFFSFFQMRTKRQNALKLALHFHSRIKNPIMKKVIDQGRS